MLAKARFSFLNGRKDRDWKHLDVILIVKVLVAQLCPTLFDPKDYSPPGFPGMNQMVTNLLAMQETWV